MIIQVTWSIPNLLSTGFKDVLWIVQELCASWQTMQDVTPSPEGAKYLRVPCICVYVNMRNMTMCIRIHICIVYIYIYTHVYLYDYTHVHTYTHAYIYIYTHAYTCINVLLESLLQASATSSRLWVFEASRQSPGFEVY